MIMSVSESGKFNKVEGPKNKKEMPTKNMPEMSIALFSMVFGMQLAIQQPSM